jgi:predicted RNA polymerase sigma factor
VPRGRCAVGVIVQVMHRSEVSGSRAEISPPRITRVPAVVDEVWRAEASSMRGALARRLGDLDRAEDALQEALAEALRRWPADGVPDNPAGWLVTSAWRKALDMLRREQTGRAKLAIADAAPSDDDLLALIFGCCHPSLPQTAQVALTLRAVCGLSTEEIAAAFLVPVPTMAQRLVRANRLIRSLEVPFSIPEPDEYADRLDAVLAVIYLVYNEGYLASGHVTPHRRDLAIQARALTHQLELLMPAEPEVIGLGVLIGLCEARSASRFDEWGRLVLLSDQDRRAWDHEAIQAAVARLDRVLAKREPGPYQTQAAIAALHATAPSYADTDWPQVWLLYQSLYLRTGNPVALLSAAVATWHRVGAERALNDLSRVAGELDGYRLFHATRAELLHALGREEEGHAALKRALALAANPAERSLLNERLSSRSVDHHGPDLDGGAVLDAGPV